MSLQRVTQAAALILFVGFLLLAAHPLQEGLPVDLFLRLENNRQRQGVGNQADHSEQERPELQDQ